MRAIAIACLVLVSVMLAAPAVPASAQSITMTTTEKRMLRLINATRVRHGLHRLRVVASLERAARRHSCDMLDRDYFSHYSYGGATFGARLVAFGYARAGTTSWRTGEVIGWGKGTAGTARAIFNAWLRSPGHRKVIFTKCWRDVGVGAHKGGFGGLDCVRMFTVDFGRRTY